MGLLERLALIECPELVGDDERGHLLRRFAGVVEALAEVCPWVDVVRPGVCTLPIRGPARYFGTESAVLARVREVVVASGRESEEVMPVVRVGVAEGVFAATLAAKVQMVVPPGATDRFLARWPVDVLGDGDLAELLVRLGLPTVGAFAALPTADVLARFGAAGARCHRIARALDGELPGYRVPGLGSRLVTALGRDLPLREHQPGFWGGASAADERAAEVLTSLQRQLGSEAVVVPVVGGGRGPSDRFRLVPWRPGGPTSDPVEVDRKGGSEVVPWPGRLPAPAPARVGGPGDGPSVDVVDRDGAAVGVTARGLLTGRPDRVSIAGGPWTPVSGWSAPWPAEERWWTTTARRSARLQVTTVDARAHLLLLERGRWRLEATYD